jgi:hypothetical protein
MSPIIDFVRRQLSSTKLQEEGEQHAATTDLISRSGYLNEGKWFMPAFFFFFFF